MPPSREPAASSGDERLDRAVAAMASADARDARCAREELISLAAERVRSLAHRMLTGSARVRRWEDTDDVVQGALLRLHRALGTVVPNDTQHFLRLAALQVRRELIDLTRRHGSSESFAANHETNSLPDDRRGQRSDRAEDPTLDAAQKLADWTRFHHLAASLPDDERQLFDMVWYLGMTQDAIATVLGCSSRTIRRRWEETKLRFMESFKDQPPG